ncbi:acetyltransferase (GNAT) family domain-containing protein [Ditylenchus destructor]|nr:acetyltransferase (GNAT) family domain-containing protein [Ditylenchus destructor]
MNFALFVVALVLTHVCSVAGMQASTSRGKVPGCQVEQDEENGNLLLCLNEKREEYGSLTYSYESGSPWLSFDNVSVKKKFRNKGVAELLVNYLITHVAQPGKFKHIVLLVEESNTYAVQLYTRADFKFVDESSPKGPKELVYNMIRTLA